MTLPKKLLFYSLLLLLTLAAVEGMARVAYYLAYAEWYSTPPTPDFRSGCRPQCRGLPGTLGPQRKSQFNPSLLRHYPFQPLLAP